MMCSTWVTETLKKERGNDKKKNYHKNLRNRPTEVRVKDSESTVFVSCDLNNEVIEWWVARARLLTVGVASDKQGEEVR